MKTLNHILVTRPEYQKTLFNKAVGKNGKTYYYNGDPTKVWVDGDGEGMGGRTVSYELMEGGVDEVKGPWNTNSDDLLANTGVDLTQNHFTYGLVFSSREDSLRFIKGEAVEPVISDEDWTKGAWKGGVERMKDKAIALGLDYNDNLDIVMVNSMGSWANMSLRSVL
jgi:hypothetical protein